MLDHVVLPSRFEKATLFWRGPSLKLPEISPSPWMRADVAVSGACRWWRRASRRRSGCRTSRRSRRPSPRPARPCCWRRTSGRSRRCSTGEPTAGQRGPSRVVLKQEVCGSQFCDLLTVVGQDLSAMAGNCQQCGTYDKRCGTLWELLNFAGLAGIDSACLATFGRIREACFGSRESTE